MNEQVVQHPIFGKGVVQKTRYRGFELDVLFHDGISRWVRCDEIVAGQPAVPAVETASAYTAASEAQFVARRRVEAFRLGIVPYDTVEAFTFGRGSEIYQMERWLRNTYDPVFTLIGEYGSGKTHLLQYFERDSLKEGYAVATVTLEPNETPFSRPKRVYSELIRTFRYRDPQSQQIQPFRTFLNVVLETGAFSDHFYFKHLINKMDNMELLDWIEARSASVRPLNNPSYRYIHPLYDNGVAANIYCYLLSAIGWAAKNIMNMPGLLLMFDEAETLWCGPSSTRALSLNFLDALIRTANDEYLFTFPPQSGFIGLPEYSRYCGNVPFAYGTPSGLKLLFALTPIENLIERFGKGFTEPLYLENLSEGVLYGLVKKLCDVYASAHGEPRTRFIDWDIYQRVMGANKSASSRLFVKACIEALDIDRLGRNAKRVRKI